MKPRFKKIHERSSAIDDTAHLTSLLMAKFRQVSTSSSIVSIDFNSVYEKFFSCPVLLSSSPRGGSTFANAAIGVHPDILCVNWNDKLLHNLWAKRHYSDTNFRKLILREPHYFNRERATQILGHENLTSLEKLIEGICLTKDFASLYCLHGILYWVMSAMPIPVEQIKYWLCKANTFKNMDLVLSKLPNSKFIIVQRDPRPTALSLSKVKANRKHISNEDVLISAVDWSRQAMGYAKFIMESAEKSTVINYEGLVADPTNHLNRVYQFLGLPTLDCDTINKELTGIPLKRTSSVYDQEFGTNNPQPYGVQMEGVNRWKTQLSEEQINIINNMTSPFARIYGYELTSNGIFYNFYLILKFTRLSLTARQFLRWFSAKLQLSYRLRGRKFVG